MEVIVMTIIVKTVPCPFLNLGEIEIGRRIENIKRIKLLMSVRVLRRHGVTLTPIENHHLEQG